MGAGPTSGRAIVTGFRAEISLANKAAIFIGSIRRSRHRQQAISHSRGKIAHGLPQIVLLDLSIQNCRRPTYVDSVNLCPELDPDDRRADLARGVHRRRPYDIRSRYVVVTG
jgi:hypothetical protein